MEILRKCWNCGGDAVLLDQVSFEEYGIKDTDGLAQFYKCKDCKAEIEYLIPDNKKEEDEMKNNPFKYKGESKMTRTERVEDVAHVVYQQIKDNGDCTWGFLLKYFPTYSEETINEGEQLALKAIKNEKGGE